MDKKSKKVKKKKSSRKVKPKYNPDRPQDYMSLYDYCSIYT